MYKASKSSNYKQLMDQTQSFEINISLIINVYAI